MREASVVGFMPSNSAAPPGPKILPPVCFSAVAMPSRSWRFNSSRVSRAGFETDVSRRGKECRLPSTRPIQNATGLLWRG